MSFESGKIVEYAGRTISRGSAKRIMEQIFSRLEKWDEITMNFLQPVGEKIMALIRPEGSETILDIASGTGEPALSIAQNLSNGKVIMTDIAEEMLLIAKENARNRNITNIETKVCDASDLPFGNNSFAAVSCRFGFMFFPDMQKAANEMNRVLKTGGKMATSVWDIPEKNFWVTAIMGTIIKYVDVPENPSGAPGMFRCCKPGMMKEIFEQAGFRNITAEKLTLTLHCGTAERYWNMMTEIGAPIVAALGKADSSLREKIRIEVLDLVSQKYPGDHLQLDASAIVLSAEK